MLWTCSYALAQVCGDRSLICSEMVEVTVCLPQQSNTLEARLFLSSVIEVYTGRTFHDNRSARLSGGEWRERVWIHPFTSRKSIGYQGWLEVEKRWAFPTYTSVAEAGRSPASKAGLKMFAEVVVDYGYDAVLDTPAAFSNFSSKQQVANAVTKALSSTSRLFIQFRGIFSNNKKSVIERALQRGDSTGRYTDRKHLEQNFASLKQADLENLARRTGEKQKYAEISNVQFDWAVLDNSGTPGEVKLASSSTSTSSRP